MAIYQRDRNFQHIIDEIEVETIPLRFVRGITCILNNGLQVDLEQSDFLASTDASDLEQFIKKLDFFEQLTDLKIRIDFTLVEKEASDQVTQILRKIDDQSNPSV